METIALTKSGVFTIVKVTDPANGLQRAIATSAPTMFKYNASTEKITFPDNCELDNLHLELSKLDSATVSALSSPTNNSELFDALITGQFFEGK